MKRSKAVNQEKALRYMKLTGGLHFTADGRCVKKGEVFECLPSQMPKTFLSSFECLDKPAQASNDDGGARLEIKPAGKNRWNIVNNRTGKPINTTPLTAPQAKAFLSKGEKLPEFVEEAEEAEEDPEDMKADNLEDPEEEEFDD